METQDIVSEVIAAEPRCARREKANRPAVSVPMEALLPLMRMLRDENSFNFDMLCYHTAVDWLGEGQIELVYQLYSSASRRYLMVSTRAPRENAHAPSVSSIWRIAEWQEREVYDMFGVIYSGHPDLRRILLEDEWQGYPLRKDYKDDHMWEPKK